MTQVLAILSDWVVSFNAIKFAGCMLHRNQVWKTKVVCG